MRTIIHTISVLAVLIVLPHAFCGALPRLEDNSPCYVTDMPIPLDASVQQVMYVLEQYGVSFEGAWKKQDEALRVKALWKDLSGACGRFLPTNECAALEVFQQRMGAELPSFFYLGKEYFLTPSSSRCLGGAYTYSLFREDPGPYFSQYALTCRDLPPNARFFGMSQIWIVFASFDGQPPRSFIVALANPNCPSGLTGSAVIKQLRARYGPGKLYYGVSENCPEAVGKLQPFKSQFPEQIQKKPGQPIWEDVVSTGCANDDFGDGVVSFPFSLDRRRLQVMLPADAKPLSFPCPPFPSNADCRMDYTLEWQAGDTRVLASGVESPEWLSMVHYVYYPAFSSLQSLYSRFYGSSKRQQEAEQPEKYSGLPSQ
jgi:hypothetical protein